MVNSFTDSVELTQAWAEQQDLIDPLSSFRSEFHIPSITDITRPTLAKPPNEPASQPSIYLCGNSLGVQPRRTAAVIDTFLAQWRTKGVKGHFLEHQDSSLAPFLHVDDAAAKLMAPIVGALTSEVAVMGTLTANLHALLCSFYKPTKTGERRRWKIMLEGKAFPSDHFAVESQIQHWGLDPAEAMILLEPEDANVPILKTEDILRKIDEHSEQLAVLLLPGIQFYTGQLFDIKTITAYAQSKGVIVGWDCAHAAGNVELKLHEWNVDFAAWCTYKYLNAGPGAMAGIFVHERYGRIEPDTGDYWPRLTGWWGDDKSGRFAMTNKFAPRPGAAGFQLSNPSALDLASVVASLQIFNETTMAALRERSLRLTGFLERLLEQLHGDQPDAFTIITPRDPESRGSQLSLRLRPHTLEKVLASLEEHGVVVDERRPDVIRVAPAPLFNTFADVWHFCRIFEMALQNSK